MFDEEADTISVDVGSDTMQAIMACSDETDVIIRMSRPGTDSDWPPAPKPPGSRQFRRAGVYKAITVSSIIKIK